MLDLLLPSSDAGVIAQVVVVVALWLGGVWMLRNRPDARLLVLGGGLVVLALIGIGALH